MILVTGATGLIGSFVCRKLIAEGHTVRALRRKSSSLKYISDISNGIEWFEGDVMNTESLERAMQDVSKVIHCAAVVSFDISERESLFNINVEGTANVVNLCLEKKVQKLIHVSSVAAIGRGKPDGVLNESTPWENSKDNTYYAKSKYLSELEVWRGIEEGLDAFIINPSVVLGPGDWHKSSTKAFNLVYNNSKFYSTGHMNYIDVRDVVDILVELMKQDETGERYILNGGRVTVKEFYTKVAEEMGLKKPRYRITYKMALFGMKLLWLRWLFTGKKSSINREILKTLKKSHFFDNNKIISRLNYTFRSIEDSIQWTVRELKANQQLK